jgi:hypothetical protein
MSRRQGASSSPLTSAHGWRHRPDAKSRGAPGLGFSDRGATRSTIASHRRRTLRRHSRKSAHISRLPPTRSRRGTDSRCSGRDLRHSWMRRKIQLQRGLAPPARVRSAKSTTVNAQQRSGTDRDGARSAIVRRNRRTSGLHHQRTSIGRRRRRRDAPNGRRSVDDQIVAGDTALPPSAGNRAPADRIGSTTARARCHWRSKINAPRRTKY